MSRAEFRKMALCCNLNAVASDAIRTWLNKHFAILRDISSYLRPSWPLRGRFIYTLDIQTRVLIGSQLSSSSFARSSMRSGQRPGSL